MVSNGHVNWKITMKPRYYQSSMISGVREQWSEGHKNVVAVSPPRSGKTPTAAWLSEPFIKAGQGVVFAAHREELVRQLAMTYAQFGYPHNIMAPKDVVSDIIMRQHRKFKRSFYDQRSNVLIGSVQTINARKSKLATFAPRVGLWMMDEAHHCLTDNQWGKVISLFPKAYGVGFTATPGRTDRKSLARIQGGVFDAMVKGLTARQLIDEGYICDYRIIAPPSSIDREKIKTGAKGDFTQKGLSEAKHESTITGDCVESYLKYAPGKQAVVFGVDLVHAADLNAAYKRAGVASEMVSSKTPKNVRKMIMDKFERGKFKVLVNVDLFGEGLNVEGIEVVIMARPTKSFVLFTQQFFRALTKADGKSLGTIIDHAGNVGYFGRIYGLPDTYNGWTLVNEEHGKRSGMVGIDDDLIKVTTCKNEGCWSPYEAVLPKCPFCGHAPVPADRSAPEHVDGDLEELDLETLRALRGEVERVDDEVYIPNHLVNTPAEGAIRKRHRARKKAQGVLRYNITLWAAIWRDRGRSDSEIYRRFYDRFDTDILTAQTLGEKLALELAERVDKEFRRLIANGI